jgi:N-acetyl-anhydromuramyl-L-alanine amidase AmpD
MKTSKKAKDTRTPEQKRALVKLVKSLMAEYKLKATDVYGHCQFDTSKACPSFEIESLRKYLVD